MAREHEHKIQHLAGTASYLRNRYHLGALRVKYFPAGRVLVSVFRRPGKRMNLRNALTLLWLVALFFLSVLAFKLFMLDFLVVSQFWHPYLLRSELRYLLAGFFLALLLLSYLVVASTRVRGWAAGFSMGITPALIGATLLSLVPVQFAWRDGVPAWHAFLFATWLFMASDPGGHVRHVMAGRIRLVADTTGATRGAQAGSLAFNLLLCALLLFGMFGR